MIGGGYYEPILISIPPEDRREQIERLGDYIEKHFGKRPQRRMVDGARLGAAASFDAGCGGDSVHAGGRQSFSERGF